MTKRAQKGAPPFVGFIGDRVPDQGGGAPVYVCSSNRTRTPLDPRHDIRNHSPGGFQWGYGGSGPAQLALAICAHCVGAARAERIYQDFKGRVVAQFGDSWELSRAEALQIIKGLEAERGL